MNLFSKENQITPTVWNFKNFIDVNFFDDYIEVLKQTYNGNNSIDWVINNCDLNGLQDIVDTSELHSGDDAQIEFAERLDRTNSGKADGSASTYTLQITESDSWYKETSTQMSENSIKVCNKEIPFNKDLYNLYDKVIEYGNEKYGVDDWELVMRSHAAYPPMHFINPHTHWPETEITAVIPLNHKPDGALGGDLFLIDASDMKDFPRRSAEFFDHSGQGGLHVDHKWYENLVIDNLGHKRGDVFLFDDVLPLKGFVPPEKVKNKYIYNSLDKYDQNSAAWVSTAHCISRVENWCRLSLLLFFESKKMKEYKPKGPRGTVLDY